ncbi:MAG TPA: twin-arginine translocase TatA/TatE family subunit [Myxococcales bacterium]|nr:twin-arginine translocase TatA/TatE family subunit [Myxococcales bacterium]HAN30692.1 twin-arginine translocase TatA/TatE family subunit [Myxococcales bacterium]
MAMLGLPEMLVILAIVVVLFGASKLPQLGKGMGEAIGNFKKAQRASADEANEAIDATPKLTSSQAESVTTEFEQDKSNA